ncbi:MAG: baseplate J/gp47 family protein [Lachnospiraceae bacterium]|nr:baseplate J/gp47 family protein [Lachnospiraceae bacterium]MBO5145465.1 baseplate J/gp47 family protein [Lachnospiraceae bacterium]
MAKIDVLDNLPPIDMLADEGITFETIVNEMIADYETYWKELTGEELTLYPADSRRIMLNVAAGKLYQLAAIINERHKLNFLQYMYGDFTRNWAANFGFKEDGVESAEVTLRFHLAAAQPTDIVIPAGTRATSGDYVFFATDEELIIPAGETYADTSATCTQPGTTGNGYVIGQINVMADPVNLVESVENTTQSIGGHDKYTNQELKELIYNFPSAYSTAGPAECYEQIAKTYSSNIVDTKVITSQEALVQIYILLQNGIVPTMEYCRNVMDFIKKLKTTPDTDKIDVLAPGTVNYEVEATYYISDQQKDIADALKEAIEDAGNEFTFYTRSKIGRAINPNVLVTYANAAGASRLEIEEPKYKAIRENEVAVCSSIKMTFGGLEKE